MMMMMMMEKDMVFSVIHILFVFCQIVVIKKNANILIHVSRLRITFLFLAGKKEEKMRNLTENIVK